jgi:hypothetical protein
MGRPPEVSILGYLIEAKNVSSDLASKEWSGYHLRQKV